MNENHIKLIHSEFGYAFHPKQRENSPGHPGVEIIIKPENVQKPRDIMNVTIITVHSTSGIERITFSHPTTFHGQFHVAPGRIIMKNHKGDKSELFTLGGILHVESNEFETKCTVVSSAPILELDPNLGQTNIQNILTEEIEDLFAILRVRLVLHDHTFLEQLAMTDPILLYMICLDSINEKLQETNLEELSDYAVFHQFLINEISNLKKENLWPSGIIKTFEDVLGKHHH